MPTESQQMHDDKHKLFHLLHKDCTKEYCKAELMRKMNVTGYRFNCAMWALIDEQSATYKHGNLSGINQRFWKKNR